MGEVTLFVGIFFQGKSKANPCHGNCSASNIAQLIANQQIPAIDTGLREQEEVHPGIMVAPSLSLIT